MTDKKRTTTDEIETNMACIAFAEAGEPCPIRDGKQEGAAVKVAVPTGQESALAALENDFACTAFHEQNETCPIHKERK
ncbi:MAG: hypothetical protein COZ12_09020 [Deltaproteobacteria bacterium CG_4_10_14_3_um_filter_60_8]|nr:MAG: hypothetical protein AUK28_04110 [Desulfobacterales bacterium CG2_30_60_27]PIP43302.1 MAG: hypothetical protein COX17_07735 [Deltaproteobacteria bacterium CG23_combo_of_CG06-09_8_20_14_all_60_8]PIY20603.1 MAG: hypothetical protein COZ12_09020 [Deltaproteobacteria bacterium CG_4_10_14_3_um_filter_60_8]